MCGCELVKGRLIRDVNVRFAFIGSSQCCVARDGDVQLPAESYQVRLHVVGMDLCLQVGGLDACS